MILPAHCPLCSADFKGALIPPEHREVFGGEENFSRVMGIEMRGEDRISKWKCPDCGGEWRMVRN